MGVIGLTKFISDRAETLLRPYELKDTYLIIDGCNLVWQFYRMHMKNLCAFGGDYDVLHYELKTFFMNLAKCNVKPIVIFDGSLEKRKLNTINKRCRVKVAELRKFSKSCWTGVFLPLFTSDVLVQVLEELNITKVRCLFEADKDIAALANYLNCPVLSQDSDFYIYDVLYIPFETLDIQLRGSGSNLHMQCKIYDVTNLLSEFEGLTKPMLPLLAALLGNDYAENHVYFQFFQHVILPKSTQSSYSQRQILGLFHYLKSETFESAKKLILSHVKKEKMDKAIEIINDSVSNYKHQLPSILSLLKNKNIPEVDKNADSVVMEVPDLLLKLPEKLMNHFYNCKVGRFVIDMVNLNSYYLTFQVEDVRQDSSHCISVPIIVAIDVYLKNLTGIKKPLWLFWKMNYRFRKFEIDHTSIDCFSGIDIKNLMDESDSVKKKVFYRVLSLNENDISVLDFFDNNWALFAMSVIYWAKNRAKLLCDTHIYVVLLMAVGNFVQSQVGYYRNYQSFMRHKAGKLNRLLKEKIPDPVVSGSSFSELLKTIPAVEFYIFTRHFIKVRQTSEEVTSRGYLISTIHLFASLQSVLHHVKEFNSILNFPFPDIVVSELYSGTLLYNLYYLTNKRSNALNYLMENLRDSPNISSIFRILTEKFAAYIPGVMRTEKPVKAAACEKRKLKGKERR